MYKVPEDSVLFKEVASVIGKEEARKQLDIVAPTFTSMDVQDIEDGDGLSSAFVWYDTPQGKEYWNSIDDRLEP